MNTHWIHVKITNAENTIKYISAIRKYDTTPISIIKNRILTGFAYSVDWQDDGDFIDYMNETNPRQIFRMVVDDLISSGANLEFYEEYNGNTTIVSLQFIDNLLQSAEGIQAEVELDIEREVSSLSCYHVMEENHEILHISQIDNEDNIWVGMFQFLCGNNHDSGEITLVDNEEIGYENFISIIDELPFGHQAEREDEKSEWIISPKLD